MGSKYGIINMETGELIRQSNNKNTLKAEMSMNIKKEDLLDPSDDLINFLYSEMKKCRCIDNFGMIKVDGVFVSDLYFEIGRKAGIFAENIFALKQALSISGVIKKTKTSDCSKWSEVMISLGITPTNKTKSSKLKKILLDNDIVRVERRFSSKLGNQKCFVVNPNIIRRCSYTSAFCISSFKDCTLNKVDKYNKFLMFLNRDILYEDLD